MSTNALLNAERALKTCRPNSARREECFWILDEMVGVKAPCFANRVVLMTCEVLSVRRKFVLSPLVLATEVLAALLLSLCLHQFVNAIVDVAVDTAVV